MASQATTRGILGACPSFWGWVRRERSEELPSKADLTEMTEQRLGVWAGLGGLATITDDLAGTAEQDTAHAWLLGNTALE